MHGRAWRGGQVLGIAEVSQRAGEWRAAVFGECGKALTLLAVTTDFRDLRFSPRVWLGRGYEVHIYQRRVLLFLDAEVVMGLGNAEEGGLCS